MFEIYDCNLDVWWVCRLGKERGGFQPVREKGSPYLLSSVLECICVGA